MSFVYDYGGKIAELRNGRWVGTLNSPQAIQGLTKLKSVVGSLSRANKTGDEANPQQALVFSKGRVGSFIGNGWEWPYALDKKVGNPSLAKKMGAYPMPSHIKGKYMPAFLGGSDLAVPVTSRNKSLAYDWIRAFTNNAQMRQLATVGKVIPNTTTLASIHARNPQLAPFAAASKSSYFVPTAPNWVQVENARVLQTMLQSIFTGRSSVEAAADAREQPDHHDPQPEDVSSGPGGETGFPALTAAAAEAAIASAAAPCHAPWRSPGRCAPYALLAPAALVIAAVLGYPLYLLGRLSFQQFGLAELILQEGPWIGLDNYTRLFHDRQFWTVLAADVRLHVRERRPDDGARHADRAPADPARLASCGCC